MNGKIAAYYFVFLSCFITLHRDERMSPAARHARGDPRERDARQAIGYGRRLPHRDPS